MRVPRRIAAALLAAAMSLGVVGAVAGPAEAKSNNSSQNLRADTTWPI